MTEEKTLGRIAYDAWHVGKPGASDLWDRVQHEDWERTGQAVKENIEQTASKPQFKFAVGDVVFYKNGDSMSRSIVEVVCIRKSSVSYYIKGCGHEVSEGELLNTEQAIECIKNFPKSDHATG